MTDTNIATKLKCTPAAEWSAGTIVGIAVGVGTAMGTATHHLAASLAITAAISIVLVVAMQWFTRRKPNTGN